MSLKVFNTLTGQLEAFSPLIDGSVGIYVCGPTVYDWSHIGHARTYVAFDIIIRWLEYRGFKVFYVQNITDVGHLTEDTAEDKVVKRAEERSMEPMALVETYMREYFRDMDLLGVRRPDISPRATGHMVEIIDAVQRLLANGYAYEVDGDVFFDISEVRRYGELSGFDREQMMAGSRSEVSPKKRAPEDFALWKKAQRGSPLRWKSPWGEGFPGWHIECSVMSTRYLGHRFDIHGGARDLVFPHHENEIAQCEGLTGDWPFANYWLHTGLLTINGQKMAKSLGNYVTVREALKQYDPEVLRLLIASAHYRSELDYSTQRIEEAKVGLGRLYTSLRNIEEEAGGGSRSGEDDRRLLSILDAGVGSFARAMDDDFNTPKAVATLFDLCHDLNRLLSERTRPSTDALRKASATLRELGAVLGILQERPETARAEQKVVDELVDLLLEARNEARKKSDWGLADRIRERLTLLGFTIEDHPDRSAWRRS